MKIVVCVKQVPEVTDIQVDAKTGTLIREGVQAILNPFCEYALDQAVRLAKEIADAEIIALTMGPMQAKAALTRCLELGADRAVLVSDRRFAGADTWATSCTLAASIRQFVPDFDLVLLGKQAIDGDTAQVGPELAEILAIPQITYAVELALSESHRRIRVRREIEEGYEVVEASLPALITVSRGETVRRFPSLSDLLRAADKPIQTITAADLPVSEEELGLAGSFTRVVKVFPPQMKKQGQVISGLDADEAAVQLAKFLRSNGFIS